MKKQIIYFEKEGYEYAIKSLDKAIEVINRYSQQFTVNGFALTTEDVKLIVTNPTKFKNEVFHIRLKEICEEFGLNYDEVSKFEFTIKNNMFSDMANGKCRYLYEFADELCDCLRLIQYLALYIDIENNVASKTLEADELIRDVYTSYTKTEKQNKALELTKKLQDLYRQFEKLEISRCDISHLIQYNGDIDPDAFYKCTE